MLKTLTRRCGRFVVELVRAQHRDLLYLHAAALAYTTLLSLVPLLTVALVMIARVQPERAEVIIRAIATLFPYSPVRVQATLATFAERTAALGWVAIAISILVIFNAFFQIEEVINTIWGLGKRRRWQVRLFSFSTVLVCGPLFVAALFSILYWLSSRSWFPAIAPLARPVPAFLAMLALAFVYRWVPHTHVPWRAAWVGAVVGASGLTALHLGFQSYLNLASDLNVIYGSLSLLLFFLISLYLFWLAILLGAEASWVVGHTRVPHPESAAAVVELLADMQSEAGVAAGEVRARLGEATDDVVAQLGLDPPLIVRSQDRFRLARGADVITLGEIRRRVGARSVADQSGLSVAAIVKMRETAEASNADTADAEPVDAER